MGSHNVILEYKQRFCDMNLKDHSVQNISNSNLKNYSNRRRRFRVVTENEKELEDLPDFDKLSITD
uniref:Uncharacterized protein n=1 Tax=Cucumis melo TaxID=3656 RepID=A0A9I9EIU6_CUCME